MVVKFSETLLKNYDCFVIESQGINNYISQDREVIKQLKDLNLSNLNPALNLFNIFLQRNNFLGIAVDIGLLRGEIYFVENGDKSLELKLTDSEEIGAGGLQKLCPKASSRNVLFLAAVKKCRESKKEGQGWQELVGFANILDLRLGGKHKLTSAQKQYTPKEVAGSKSLSGKNYGENRGVRKRKDTALKLIEVTSVSSVFGVRIEQKLRSFYPDLVFEGRVHLTVCPNLSVGDYATNLPFVLSKILSKPPQELSADLEVKLSDETGFFKNVSASSSGFLNFTLLDHILLDFLQEVKTCRINLPKNKNILIESPSPNSNKPLHVGHLRNICLSRSLSAIYSKLGFNVHNDNLINDKGLPIFKLVWAYQKYAAKSSPEKESLKGDHFVGKYYTIGNEKFESSKKYEKGIRDLLKSWEYGDKEVDRIWRKLRDWALDGQEETIKNLNEDLGHLWFESEIYAKSKEMVLGLVDDKDFIKTDDGAIVGKLEEKYGVPDVVLLKSDGTSLYHTQDMYLTVLKVEKFNPWKAIWVVGNEQIAHFQKLFSAIDMAKLLPIDNLYHLAYGFVFGKDGKKISSRDGDVMSIDEMLELIKNEVVKSRKDIDDNVAKAVSLGALKYAFLLIDPFKDINFDLEKSVSFNGKSGPYVMYAYARAFNILSKAKKLDFKYSKDVQITDLERELVIKCLEYKNILVASANNYSPSILAEYLYDLSKLFNQMYEKESILKEKGEVLNVRLMIVHYVKEILGEGLNLLKIEPLERM